MVKVKVQKHQTIVDEILREAGPTATRANEIEFALIMTVGGRIHACASGLEAAEIEGKDGLR